MSAGAQAYRPALDRPALVLAQATPYPGVLPGVNGPAKALLNRGAAPAHLLGFLNLQERGSAVPDRKEQLRIHLTTGGDMAPVHDFNSFLAERARCAHRTPLVLVK